MEMETMLSNGDSGAPQATVDDGDISYKQKYRDLKRRLKYLVYVSSGLYIIIATPTYNGWGIW